MIGAGYLLSKKYMERLGLGENVASIVCTVLWLLCGPIYKVVSKGQINLFVLDFFLVSVVLAESKPVLAGMAAAAGSFMKIYPAATAGGAVLARRKKLLIGFALGTVLMLLIQTMLCGVIHGLTLSTPSNRFRLPIRLLMRRSSTSHLSQTLYI